MTQYWNDIVQYWNSIEFKNWEAFFLLAIPALLAAWYWWRYNRQYPELKLPSTAAFSKQGSSLLGKLKPLIPALRLTAFALLVVALARPQSRLKETNEEIEGIDIVLAIDVSTSMLARDLKPDRLEAAKQVASDFVSGRPNDRMGLVVFAGESFTQCPLTTDHEMLKKLLSELKPGIIEDGTAIGMGLATSVDRLKDSEAKSKVVILVTDGVNNRVTVTPETAAEIAREFGVRLYTIGAGTIGQADYPMQFGGRTFIQKVDVEIDEKLLQEIAEQTGGKYYRAKDTKSLKHIYEEIDSLEKSKIKVASIQRVSEEFYPFALAALAFFLLEILFRYVFLKSVP